MLDVVRRVAENEVSICLGEIHQLDGLWPTLMGVGCTFGKQSRSNTNACSSCPVASGITIQLPHHHGLFLNQPSSSNKLYKYSAALVTTYIAMVIRN